MNKRANVMVFQIENMIDKSGNWYTPDAKEIARCVLAKRINPDFFRSECRAQTILDLLSSGV